MSNTSKETYMICQKKRMFPKRDVQMVSYVYRHTKHTHTNDKREMCIPKDTCQKHFESLVVVHEGMLNMSIYIYIYIYIYKRPKSGTNMKRHLLKWFRVSFCTRCRGIEYVNFILCVSVYTYTHIHTRTHTHTHTNTRTHARTNARTHI